MTYNFYAHLNGTQVSQCTDNTIQNVNWIFNHQRDYYLGKGFAFECEHFSPSQEKLTLTLATDTDEINLTIIGNVAA